jgi:hypothetical protein
MAGRDELEHYQQVPPFSIGLVAQTVERPVVCGVAEGATPFGSAIFVHRNVAQSSEHPAWDRVVAGENPAIPTILKLLLWPSEMRHSSSKRIDAGANPASSSSLPLPGSVKVARRPVKPLVLVRVQPWQPFSVLLV